MDCSFNRRFPGLLRTDLSLWRRRGSQPALANSQNNEIDGIAGKHHSPCQQSVYGHKCSRASDDQLGLRIVIVAIFLVIREPTKTQRNKKGRRQAGTMKFGLMSLCFRARASPVAFVVEAYRHRPSPTRAMPAPIWYRCAKHTTRRNHRTRELPKSHQAAWRSAQCAGYRVFPPAKVHILSCPLAYSQKIVVAGQAKPENSQEQRPRSRDHICLPLRLRAFRVSSKGACPQDDVSRCVKEPSPHDRDKECLDNLKDEIHNVIHPRFPS